MILKPSDEEIDCVVGLANATYPQPAFKKIEDDFDGYHKDGTLNVGTYVLNAVGFLETLYSPSATKSCGLPYPDFNWIM